jgi:hypothetical protein
MLYVARARYRGPYDLRRRRGSRPATHGALHFDNSCIAALGEGTRIRTGVRLRGLRESLRTSPMRPDDPTQRAGLSRRDLDPRAWGAGWVRVRADARGPRRRLLARAPHVAVGVCAFFAHVRHRRARAAAVLAHRSDLLENFGGVQR